MVRPDKGRKRSWRFRLNEGTILEVSAPEGPTEKQVRRRGRVALVLGALLTAGMLVGVAGGAVWTDQQDYAPGSQVTISGDNGNDAGYVEGNTVDVAVSGPNGWTASCSATVAAGASWSCTVMLDSDPSVAVGDYSYTATSTDAEGHPISESGTFTDAAAANVNWATSGLPSGTSVTVTYSGTNNGGQPVNNQTVTFTTPLASTNVGLQPGSSLTFSFPATLAGCTLSTTSVASPTTTPAAQGSTTITGTYVCATPPGDPGVPYLDAGSTTPNNTGNFQVDWNASSTSGVTYELQKRDVDDAVWTNVSLTNASLTNQLFSSEAEGSWRYQVRAAKSGQFSAWVANPAPIVVVDKTAPNAPTAAATTPSVYTDGSSHTWWKDTVTVSFAANGDPNLLDTSAGSGVNAPTLSASQTFTTLGLNTATGTVDDNAGNTSLAGTLDVYVDNSKPVVQFTDCPSSPLILGSSASANWTATDTGSDLATASSGSVTLDTSSVGLKSVDAPTASDNVGHDSEHVACSYSVIYNWTGFFQPVDNLPTLNSVKAGSAVPVKFSLSGNQGLNIFWAGFPTSTSVACGMTAAEDVIEQTVTAGGSSLNYDLTADQYIYVWKTEKAWIGTCRTLTVKLADGTIHQANFKFK